MKCYVRDFRLNLMGDTDRLSNASSLVNSNVSKNDISNIGSDSEEPLGNGRNTGVFVVEARNKGDRIAAKVCLVVERVLGVELPLAGVESILDESSAVFKNETNLEGSSG
jgi:hypothetical protein